MFLTEKEYRNVIGGKERKAPAAKNKYRAKKTWRDGICFDSIKEANYYSELKIRRAAGAIAGYIVHGKMICTYGGDSSKEKAVTYEPDFIVLHNDGTYEIVDTKSVVTITPVFKNKMKSLKEKFPDVEIHIR